MKINLDDVSKGELWKEARLFQNLSILLSFLLGCTIVIAFLVVPHDNFMLGQFILELIMMFIFGGIFAAFIYGIIRTVIYHPNEYNSSLFVWIGLIAPIALMILYYKK